MITHDIQAGYWLDETTLTRLDELCEQLNVTRSHMVRCAVMNVDASDLDPEPINVDDAPRIDRHPTGHAAGTGLARCMLRLTRAEYEVLCRTAVKDGIPRAERIRKQVNSLLDKDERTVAGLVDSMNSLTGDRRARTLLRGLDAREERNQR